MVLAILRGLLIAIPLLLVFGGLFMAADAVFSGIVTNLFAIDIKQLFSARLLDRRLDVADSWLSAAIAVLHCRD